MSNSDRMKSVPGSIEWYTPSSIIEPVRKILGGIDLDPASCEKANEVIKAKKFHDMDEDGLYKRWIGNIWLNPPYERRHIESWIEKLLYNSECRKWACLTNNATETRWGQMLLEHAQVIYFPNRRIRFWNERNSGKAPTQGQMICFSGGVNMFSDVSKAFKNQGVILFGKSKQKSNGSIL